MDDRINSEKKLDPDLKVINEVDSSGNLPESSGVLSEIVIHETTQCLDKKINDLAPPVPEPCIFKVHEGLRSVNEKAYTPKLVSIGPYHHGESKLSAMEEHKLRYLRSFLQRVEETSVKPYLLRMEKLANRAKACYADPICLETNKFVEMLLVDAFFIIEFLLKCYYKELRDKDDTIFISSWMRMQIFRDLILLENQLPFFILSDLFDMAHIPGHKYEPLAKLAFFPIDDMLLDEYSIMNTIGHLLNKKITCESKHFLDLLHNIYLPSFGIPKHSDSNKTSTSNLSGHEICTHMSSVTELQEAGISFKVDDSDDVSIFYISFEHGQMKIPKFRVVDRTETFLRNIVAYEQHSSSVQPKYFTDYRYFLDLLINTEKDVNALRLHGIIDNWLGDDGKVAHMINKLGDGVIIDSSTFYYSNVCLKVNRHCEKPWNRAMANLRHNYFNNPWAGISTLAAVVLLLFTLIQTAVALIDLLA